MQLFLQSARKTRLILMICRLQTRRHAAAEGILQAWLRVKTWHSSTKCSSQKELTSAMRSGPAVRHTAPSVTTATAAPASHAEEKTEESAQFHVDGSKVQIALIFEENSEQKNLFDTVCSMLIDWQETNAKTGRCI